MSDTRTLPALGRTARLGSYYDATKDRFVVGANMFKKALEEGVDFVSTDNTSQRVTHKWSDSFNDKCDILDISGELKLSVLLGLVSYCFSFKVH